MPNLELRVKAAERSSDDLVLQIQDKTYDYLMISNAPTARVSAYLDRDWPKVLPMYGAIFIDEKCPYEMTITDILPGSKPKREITLPGPMTKGEQLTILIERRPKPGFKVIQPTKG